jgi:hypothetical protein
MVQQLKINQVKMIWQLQLDDKGCFSQNDRKAWILFNLRKLYEFDLI